jgi:hypothetical protein
MTVTIEQITFDCAEPVSLAEFWSEATGYREDPDDPNLPGDEQAWLQHPVHKGTALYFQRVPEAKVAKNRVHLDVSPVDRTRDEEVDRLRALGATLVSDQRRPDGAGWVVLADPEGNEFCVERSEAERSGGELTPTS